jgi:hypothetical protein
VLAQPTSISKLASIIPNKSNIPSSILFLTRRRLLVTPQISPDDKRDTYKPAKKYNRQSCQCLRHHPPSITIHWRTADPLWLHKSEMPDMSYEVCVGPVCRVNITKHRENWKESPESNRSTRCQCDEQQRNYECGFFHSVLGRRLTCYYTIFGCISKPDFEPKLQCSNR